MYEISNFKFPGVFHTDSTKTSYDTFHFSFVDYFQRQTEKIFHAGGGGKDR